MHAGTGGVGQWRIALLNPSYLGKKACTTTADGDRPYSEFESNTYQLPSNGDAAIATCTSVENSCCLHSFEDAEMEKGQGEWRIMLQIGCRCPMDLQDIFLEHVRGFKAQEMPADWHEQLMVVGSLRGGSSGGGPKGKGKGKMPAAADDGVSSSDEDAAWELEEQEQVERARQASLRAAGSTGSSSSSGGSSSSEGAGQAASSRRASSRACRPPPGVAPGNPAPITPGNRQRPSQGVQEQRPSQGVQEAAARYEASYKKFFDIGLQQRRPLLVKDIHIACHPKGEKDSDTTCQGRAGE
jgi:hypothetical protein